MELEIIIKPSNLDEAADCVRLLGAFQSRVSTPVAGKPTVINSTIEPVSTAAVVSGKTVAVKKVKKARKLGARKAAPNLPKRSCQLWTLREQNLAWNLLSQGRSIREIAEQLHRTYGAVQQRIFHMRRAGRTVSANTRPVTINVA